jgi:CHAT domain-containing protein/Tfp pilus assembly protein PilF
MRTPGCRLIAAVLVGVLPVCGFAQDLPRTTQAGVGAAEELINACIADGGLQAPERGQAAWRIKPDKVRATLAGHKGRLTSEVRNALVVACAQAVSDPRRQGEGAMLLAVLRAFAEETRDAQAHGFAAFFAGLDADNRLRPAEAVAFYEQAAKSFAAVPDLGWQAASLNNLASSLEDRGEYGPAQGRYEEALEVWRTLYPGDRYPQGHPALVKSLGGLGVVCRAQGKFDRARDCFEQAHAMCRKLYPPERYPNGHAELAATLNNLASVPRDQGDYARAQEHLEEALRMRRALCPPERFPQGHPDLALALNNLGSVLKDRGEYARAQACYEQALDMQRALYPPGRFPQGHPDLAVSLNNLGTVLEDEGEYARAQACHEQALEMCRTLYPADRYPRGHPALATSLHNLGAVLKARQEYARSQASYEQAVAMYRRLYPPDRYPDGHPDLATALNNLGGALRARGEYVAAQDYLEQALAMRRRLYPPERYPQGHPEVARSFHNVGAVLYDQGKYAEAQGYLEQAAQGRRVSPEPVRLRDPAQAASLLLAQPDTVAYLAHRAGLLGRRLTPRSAAAELRDGERACALTLALQDRFRDEVLQTDDSKLTHGARVADLIPLRVGLCGRLFQAEHRADDLRTAFATIEQGRARVFLESLGRANASRLSGLPQDLRDEEERLRRVIRLVDAELRVVQRLPGDEAAGRRLKLNEQRQKAEDEFRAFEQKLAASHPQYAALRYPQPCSDEDARLCLEDNEVALLFAVGDLESFVVVVHKKADPKDPAEGIAVIRLPGRQALADKVEAIIQRERLRRANGTRALGADLYGDLLGPLAEHIGDRNLVIVPDGPLCLLPFELLVEPNGRYLIDNRRVRYTPSITALNMIRLWEEGRKERPDRPLAAFGDPVFDPKDSRLTEPKPDRLAAAEELARREGRTRGEAFERLAASGVEVRAIGKLLGAPDAVRTDTEATEALVKKLSSEGELRRARYVHFATHGILGFDRGQPPALVLTLVGVSGQEDEYGRDDGLLTLPEVSALKLNADLVVLSACRTGQGRMHRSEGVSGLARVFLYAGSRGVVCSLWSVDDEATADLMRLMYERLEKGDSAADALRAAKLAMIADGEPPLVWAPFVLMGR